MKKAKIFITTLTILIFTLLVNVSFASAETISGTCTHTYSGLQYDTNVSINYDANTKKATVTFSRAYCGFEKALKINDKYNEGDQKAISEGYASSDEKYIAENEPERYSALKNTISNWKNYPSSAVAVYDVEVDSGIYKYKITNPVWQGAKYVIKPNASELTTYIPNEIRIRKNVSLGVNHEITTKALQGTGTSSINLKPGEVVVEDTPVSTKKHFTMLVDNFQFGNHSDYFFNGVDSNITPSLEKKASYPSGTLGYYISDKLYNNLTRGMSDKTKAYLNLKMSSRFEGACFGMSNLAGLIYDGKIKLSSFSTSAKTTYELNYPTSNKNLASALAYYHLLHNRKEIGSLLSTSTTNGEYYAKQIVNTCSNKQDGDILGVIGFNIVGTGDHAVLAYKYDKTGTGHDITIYDPNYPNKEGHLLIYDDYKNASVTNYNQIVLQGISDLCLCDEDYLIRNMMGIDDSSNVIIMIGSENAKVKVGNSSVTVANGHISNINGDIAAETIDGQTIIVSDDDSEDIDVETDGNIAIIDDNEAVNANGDGKVSVSKSGDDVEVNSNGNSQVEFITNYKKSGGLVRVTTYVPNLKVRKKNNNSLQIETSNNSKVKVEVGNVDGIKYNVDEVDTSKNAEITINDSNVEVKENGTVVKTVTEQGVQQPVLDQPIDVSQISNKSKEKAKDFSQRLIERIKSKNDTTNKFKNKGYRHSSWAEEEVARADELGIIPYSIINKLQSNITRKEFCEIAYQTVKSLTGMTDTEMKAFCSTPDSSNPYAYQYSDTAISFAYGTGIVNGYPDGSFGPNDLITRAQAAKMLVVTAEIMGKITSESGAKRFNDNPNDWSQTYINKISSIISPYTSNRVMGGDDRGNFMPLANYTCEQAVLTMERLIENVIGENANYNGGTVKAEETKPQTFAPSDNDQTYFTPSGWSWTREWSEGYNKKYFTSGKYVREDGRAVLYVESSDSPDFFAYQLYALPEGAKQDAYQSYKSSGNWSYAENTTQTGAYDEQSQLYFWEDGRQEISVTIGEWMDELYYEYGSPEGLYKLVREK